MNPIFLHNLKFQNSSRFYQYRLLETTLENGDIVKNEITKLLHCTLQYLEQDSFLIHIESFDRVHKNRTLSLSEKDFLDYTARIIDDVKLKVTATANIRDIFRFEEITKKTEKQITHLAKSFIGENAEKMFGLLRGIYSNKVLTADNLKQYNQYGLLLSNYYGTFQGNDQALHVAVKHPNLLRFAACQAQEKAILRQVNETPDELTFDITGHIDLKQYQSAFLRYFRQQRIDYNPQFDEPKLESYCGYSTFYENSGQVKEASISIAFSYGENFQKKVDYYLKEIAHDKI